MIVSMIVAMAEDRVIGLNGSMPWHLPADFAYFKKSTMGCPIIMGRKTFDSIGKRLPGRRNIVLTRSSDLVIAGCDVVTSLDEALALVDKEHEVFIIGGQQLYEQALPIANRLYLTHIQTKLEGDTCFPDYSNYPWKQIRHEVFSSDEKNMYSYSFELLEKTFSS
ncbi:type 3 dihydrofolate reductase [Leucothrix arctica]|uniref:Dihydrofolate reductase n=1 Tax=Leucothrix arctica TaxID=1481894 RepID=A0A317CK10_9GAMM|nr:type 3 dihydrofolate reductase [Leucothrix arctica]